MFQVLIAPGVTFFCFVLLSNYLVSAVPGAASSSFFLAPLEGTYSSIGIDVFAKTLRILVNIDEGKRLEVLTEGT